MIELGTYYNCFSDVKVMVIGHDVQVCKERDGNGFVVERKLKHVLYKREDYHKTIAKPEYVFERTYLKIS